MKTSVIQIRGNRPMFDPPLDAGIEKAVLALRAGGVETFESCDGSKGHAFCEPTVRFHGGRAEGHRALAVAIQCGLEPTTLRRYWQVQDGEPTGPYWELVFRPKPLDEAPQVE